MRHQLFLGLLGAALLMAAPLAAVADDIAPPPYRGAPNSVMAKFDLFGQQGGTVPGPPVLFNTGAGSTYPLSPLQPGVGNAQTLPGGGILYPISLPNFIDQEPIKYLRVQYSWFSGAPSGGPIGDAQTLNIFPSPGGVVNLVNSSPPTFIGGNIYHRWDDFEIIPNPDSERFEIVFRDADPRWVIIDTISVPEPAGLLLAVLGCLGLGIRRRR